MKTYIIRRALAMKFCEDTGPVQSAVVEIIRYAVV